MTAANKIGDGHGGQLTAVNAIANPRPNVPQHIFTKGVRKDRCEKPTSPMDMVKQQDIPPISYNTSKLCHLGRFPSLYIPIPAFPQRVVVSAAQQRPMPIHHQ
ncbi:hypothetical protein H0H87_003725 [Tephrocybe sp. NHM501043]|nr:hypothetical protein H0H87_003725 [Tephrocybe sp. NHM501043]